ncbi:hypothetical protein CRENPOLYSF2_680003 [Crenothrix polyspora]|uniref:Uncharacterized protein n=1 Tax=Crenothrix polyspora TaxID=360316 RepID=A0A1R4HHI0_9GAMM|nr:hypothetical protein [Crenothrix polyspora]SJM95675.1 hypothetical protein CRENPOLYSF2_680003 [Crenothrix polyspora]
MKKFNCLIPVPVRLFAAMPLIFGLAAIVAAPAVEAVTVIPVNIINGFIDVNGGGVSNADDLANVALWCDNAAPVRLDFINGGVDVTENGVVNVNDDLNNCDLTDENGGIPNSNQVDFKNGAVDVNEDNIINAADDATDIQLFVLP